MEINNTLISEKARASDRSYISPILRGLFCYRGENGELRVGIRRLARQQSTIPASVISSQTMHLGVLATASHAVATHTLFTVFYKPRLGK